MIGNDLFDDIQDPAVPGGATQPRPRRRTTTAEAMPFTQMILLI